jgi:uncharacterized lipoprotein
MSINAFIFVWDENGIELIIPSTQYEKIDKDNILRILKDVPQERSPLDTILRAAISRITHRNYEIYSVECDEEITESDWAIYWKENPQYCAEVIREKGYKIFSNPVGQRQK